jgi:hypothetical protein
MNPPAVIVAKGQPSDRELVALVTALTALSPAYSSAADAVAHARRATSAWSDRARLLGAMPSGTEHTWRRSYLP